jgi:hypothetical protein
MGVATFFAESAIAPRRAVRPTQRPITVKTVMIRKPLMRIRQFFIFFSYELSAQSNKCFGIWRQPLERIESSPLLFNRNRMESGED